jgi:peptidylprolyl isomerase
MTAPNERAVVAGDQIKVNYVGRFDNGELFDSSEGREPLEFTVGGEQVIAGFDRAVVGLKPEMVTVSMSPRWSLQSSASRFLITKS